MTKLDAYKGIETQAADNAFNAYIARMGASMGKAIKKTKDHKFGANIAASRAAWDAAQKPGADVLSVYDAAFNAAFTSLTARFDPTAEEMLAYERSIGQ